MLFIVENRVVRKRAEAQIISHPYKTNQFFEVVVENYSRKL